MTEEQGAEVIRILKLISVLVTICTLVLIWGAPAHAQTGPCLRLATSLRCYIGPVAHNYGDGSLNYEVVEIRDTQDNFIGRKSVQLNRFATSARVYVATTASTSPNATAGPPWNEVGENPLIGWEVEKIRVIDPDDVDRDTGWCDVPTPSGRVFIGGQWITDDWLRIGVSVSDSPGCSVAACGARPVLGRTSLDLIVWMPVVARRRAVAQ